MHGAPREEGNQHKARDSEANMLEMMRTLECRRLKNAIERQKEHLRRYVPAHIKKEKLESKVDPKYDLKGAARPARETYVDPNFKGGDPIEEDLLADYHGKMHAHEEGMKLLQYMLEYGKKKHSLLGHTRDAVSIFEEILVLDVSDTDINVNTRHCLLRCYMDNADAIKARSLIDRYPHDATANFLFTKALIEHISLTLEEKDTTVETREEALSVACKQNPYVIWCILYHEVMDEKLNDYLEGIAETEGLSSMLELSDSKIGEAIRYYESEIELWKDIENTMEWLESYVFSNKIEPPVDERSTSTHECERITGKEEEEELDPIEESNLIAHYIFFGMIRQALA